MMFEKGNKVKYGQDHRFFEGLPSGVDFEVTHFGENMYKLTAPGYGNPKDYGNGAIYVWDTTGLDFEKYTHSPCVKGAFEAV